MRILTMLMPLLGLIAFVSFVWLLIVAFKRHVLWGIGVLLLSPITAIVFAIKYWEESRRPFLIYMGSSIASLLIMIMAFSSPGGFEMLGMARRLQQGEEISDPETMDFMGATMDRMESSGLLSDQDKTEFAQMRRELDKLRNQTSDEEPTPQLSAAPATSRPRALIVSSKPLEATTTSGAPLGTEEEREEVPKTSPTGHIALDQARHFVGSTVRVVDHNGNATKGTLSDTSPGSIEITKYLTGGTIVYEMRNSEIESLQVLRY